MASKIAGLAAPRHIVDEDIATIVDLHGAEILRTTRRYSACAADAEDAYQNTLEKLLTKAPESEGDNLAGWLTVVARNEALMLRRRHKHVEPSALEDVAGEWQDDGNQPDEEFARMESLRRRREALRTLKPDQLRCLLLKADGMSYQEISRVTGISYASVNRYLTDGRRAYRRMLGRIESGKECRRLEPTLSAIADGTASAEELRSAQAHLDHCAACRAALVDFRVAPEKIAALLPIAPAGTVADHAGWLRQAAEQAQGVATGIQERVATFAANLQPGGEMAFAKKAAVVTAIAASLAAGGVGVQQAVDRSDKDSLTGELVDVTPALPTSEIGPTSAPIPGDGAEQGAEQAARTAVTPSDDDVLSARDADVAAAPPSTGDANPGEDPFTDQPQFAPAPDSGNQNGGGQGGDPYGGLAP